MYGWKYRNSWRRIGCYFNIDIFSLFTHFQFVFFFLSFSFFFFFFLSI
jgi:hypothetical protein